MNAATDTHPSALATSPGAPDDATEHATTWNALAADVLDAARLYGVGSLARAGRVMAATAHDAPAPLRVAVLVNVAEAVARVAATLAPSATAVLPVAGAFVAGARMTHIGALLSDVGRELARAGGAS